MAAFILLALGLLLSQQAEQASRTPLGKCILEGSVVKATTGEPLKRAGVILRKLAAGEPTYVTLTDASGRFVFKDLDPGRYRLWAERAGYVRQEFGKRAATRPGTILTLEPGQHFRDVFLRLVPTSAITGRVYDEDGEPISGARVEALQHRYERGQRQFVQAGAALTNDLGDYRVYGLPPGRHYLSVTYRSEASALGAASARATGHAGEAVWQEGYAPTYYPGTNDPSQASPLRVGPGGEARGIDFTVSRIHAVRIRGRAVSVVTGRSAEGARIWLINRESGIRGSLSYSQTVVQDSGGAFELRGVTPGSYLLKAKWFEGNKVCMAQQPVDVGSSDVDSIHLRMAPGAELTGRIRVEGNAQLQLTRLHVLLESRGNPDTDDARSVAVKSDGTFVLRDITDDVYDVTLIGSPEDLYLKSARLGGDDVLAAGLNLSRIRQAEILELILSSAGASIDGIVLDHEEKGFGGASIVLVPEQAPRGQRHLYKTTTTDQYGRFTLRGIAPGEYKLFAWEEVETGIYQDAEFLEQFAKRGRSVHSQAADRLSVQLELIPASEIFP